MEYRQMCLNDGEYDSDRDIFARKSIGGDEYYTLPQHANDIVHNLNLKYGSLVWCPFDKEDSCFVTALKYHGYKVCATHIDNGYDFFKTDAPAGCTAVVSNPPFSAKKEVLQRIDQMGIKFALILPMLWLNDGVPFDYGNQLMFWRKRVHFMTPDGEKNKPRTTCFGFSNGLFKQDLTIYMDR